MPCRYAATVRRLTAGLLAAALVASLVAGVAHRGEHTIGSRPCTICVHSHTPLLAAAEAPPTPIVTWPRVREVPRRVHHRVAVPAFSARAPPVV